MRFLFDRQIFLLLIVQLVTTTICFYCDKAFTYYEEYGQNSFNVTCSDINKDSEYVLKNITINNEISLTIINSTIENASPTLFKNVRNIRILNIVNSRISFDKNVPIFKTMNKMESLVIRNSNFSIGNSTFQGLEKLKNLEFNNNNISFMPMESLSLLEDLEKLDISYNKVKQLKAIPLCGLKKLKTINFAMNLLTILDNFLFKCEMSTTSTESSHISSMPPGSGYTQFYDINWPAHEMIELNLSHNQIINLGTSLDGLNKLKVLDLNHNYLGRISDLHLQSLAALEKLTLQHNKLHYIGDHIFNNKFQLRFLDLSYNNLNSISIANVTKLQQLHLENNRLVGLLISNLPNLKDVHLEYNNITELFPSDFINLPRLINVDLSGNKIILTSGLFENVPSIRYLDLSNNSIRNISENVFRGLTNLKCLDLSNNQLTVLSGNTFKDLKNLEVLNVSSNAVESLSYLSLEPLTNLKTLDIAVNKLKFIEYDVILSKLPELNNINIKYNLLTCDNLSKLLLFLKNRNIGYMHNEYLDLEKINQNIAGIPCKTSTTNILMSLKGNGSGNGPLFNFGIAMFIVLVSLILGITSYKFYIYLKRRKYRADEFELVDE